MERQLPEVDPAAWGIYASESNDATMAARVPQRIKDQWTADLAEVAASANCSKGVAAAVAVQMLHGLRAQWISSAQRIGTRPAEPSDPSSSAAAELG